MQMLLWFVLAIDGAILLAVLVKWREVRIAAGWPSATGRIVSSTAEARQVSKLSSAGTNIRQHEHRNFAAVTYVFNVDKAKFRGTRLGIGENPGDVDVAETLRRYPQGAKVTVYYDPANPKNCVLDRAPPSESFFRTALTGTIVAGAAIVALMLAVNGTWSAGFSALPEMHWTPALVSATCLAVLALVLIVAGARQERMMRDWRRTSGTILSSEVIQLKTFVTLLNPRRYFRARTIYAYSVDGVRYESDRISFGELDFSNIRGIVKSDADRFKPGDHVDVYYDPHAPSSAVLQRGGRNLHLWWFRIGGALLLLALFVAS